MSILEETGGGRWKAEEKDGDKMCDAVSARVTCCETFQYSALFIGRGLEIAARFFTPMLRGKVANSISSIPSCMFCLRDKTESGEKNFLSAGANNNPFRAQSNGVYKRNAKVVAKRKLTDANFQAMRLRINIIRVFLVQQHAYSHCFRKHFSGKKIPSPPFHGPVSQEEKAQPPQQP